MKAPGSIAARLSWGAAVLVAMALVVAATGIGLALHRFVRAQLDQRLDAQIVSLAGALEEGAPPVTAPPFDRLGSGWAWQIDRPDGKITSSIPPFSMILPPPSDHAKEDGRPQPADGTGPRGEPLILRRLTLPDATTITVAAPADVLEGPLREAMVPLALSLGILGVVLAGATYAQVRVGLRPLRVLEAEVAAIREGRAARLSPDHPRELAPLAAELNLLLDQNAAGLERARRHVANLAHGLKTPLATLSAALQTGGAAPEMLGEVERMDRQIRHHLRRARSAALQGPGRARSDLGEALSDLVLMFERLNANLSISLAVPAGLTVACERQDLDEMFGNLLDNAAKWARARIAVTARAEGQTVTILIDDDGPGLAPDAMPAALRPGQRLDETVAGDGFGLAITRELAELYNGRLALSRAPLGGLRAAVTLPR